MMFAGDMHFVNYRSSPFQIIWCSLSLFLLMIYVSIKRLEANILAKVCFEYVKSEAKQLGCYEVTLNVWAGNTPAEKFYEKMGMQNKRKTNGVHIIR